MGNAVDAMNLLRDIEGKENFLQLVTDLKVKRLVVDFESKDLNDWAQQLLNCKLRGVKIVDSPALKLNPKVN